jgi:hypothetical protein
MKALIVAATCLLLCAAASPAAVITYVANLNGASEVPSTPSLGTGSAVVTIDVVTNLLTVSVNFTGLTTATAASHIHCCTAVPDAGTAAVATTVPTFPNFPLGVTSGTYNMTFDMMLSSSWNPAFITSSGGTPALAESTLAAGLAAGTAYLNIHTTQFPGGEINGFLVPATPEPGTWLLAGAALIWLGTRRRR